MVDQACLDAALGYARLGWSVIPLQPREKRPLIRWEPYQHKAAAEQEIVDWFARWPTANVGVVTGAVSGLVVLDIDIGHAGDVSLATWERLHGELPTSVEAVTGGGGRHVYFSHPRVTMPNRVGLAGGIDLRGDGGYVVAPPSVHPSGKPYAWRSGHDAEHAAPAPMPRWLLRLALAEGDGSGPGHDLAHWRSLVREGVPQGQRNNTIASLTGYLLWHGLDPVVILDLLLCWNGMRCRPPLSADEVAGIVESIARTHSRHGTVKDS